MDTCGDVVEPGLSYAELGAELLRLRLLRGLSLRRLARCIGMTAHSGLVDYERGQRIPPADLMNALHEVLQPADDRLRTLYREAVDRRVDRRCRDLAALPRQRDHQLLPDESVRPEATVLSLRAHQPHPSLLSAPPQVEAGAHASVQVLTAVVDLLEVTVRRLREVLDSCSDA